MIKRRHFGIEPVTIVRSDVEVNWARELNATHLSQDLILYWANFPIVREGLGISSETIRHLGSIVQAA